MRDKLIEICDTNNGWVDEIPAEQFADYLIANDVVKVVRCRDCIYYESGKDYTPYCNNPQQGLADVCSDDYCSYGERKE